MTRARFHRWSVAVLVVLQLALSGCGGEDVTTPWPAGGAEYDFDRPDAYFELPDELDEISGLAVTEDGVLLAVQDEDGIVYRLDPIAGTIAGAWTFGGPGDYEAVAVAPGRILVLESDGTLHRIDARIGGTSTDTTDSAITGEEVDVAGGWGNALDGNVELAAEEIELDLPMRCDAEGLRFDEAGSRMLVSCKEQADLERGRAIYAFGPDGNRLSADPAYVLDSRAFSVSVDDHPVNEAVRSVLSDRIDLSGFGPSDLAIHPITGELFVLSSVREALVALRRDGTVTAVWSLSDEVVVQPEGFDFLPNGDLYLSSEAGDRRHGVLLRFDYRGRQATTP